MGYGLPPSKRVKWLAVTEGLRSFGYADRASGRQQFLERLDRRARQEGAENAGVIPRSESGDGRWSHLRKGWYWGGEHEHTPLQTREVWTWRAIAALSRRPRPLAPCEDFGLARSRSPALPLGAARSPSPKTLLLRPAAQDVATAQASRPHREETRRGRFRRSSKEEANGPTVGATCSESQATIHCLHSIMAFSFTDSEWLLPSLIFLVKGLPILLVA